MLGLRATAPTLYDGLDDREVVIRWATAADRRALEDLAALDGARPLEGEVLVACVDGEPWAAIAVEDGRAVADPFRPSAGVAHLLRVRAEHLRSALGRARGRRGRARRVAGVLGQHTG